MIKVSIHYPAIAGGRFDTDYYVNTHMPMSIAKLGPALRGVSVEIGVSGPLPEHPAPFVAMCHFLVDSAEAFYDAFMPHAELLQGDMENYTNIEPVIQINEVRIFQ
jgi:uncharacterized protein (TIGR02118 family)